MDNFITAIKGNIKSIIVFIAMIIALGSLFISQALISDMEQEERMKMEIWAAAMKSISTADENSDLTLALSVLNGNNTIPVIVIDNKGNIQNYRNIEINPKDSLASLYRSVSKICKAEKNIRFNLGGTGDDVNYIDIFYDDSTLLKRLESYPYIQLSVVIIFVIISGLLLTNLKKIEENKVWAGLSKETAHQLGTPISSLLAWQEILEEKYPGDETIEEIKRDIQSLKTVADRFSKIGSGPEAEMCDISEILKSKADYISKRISNKINVVCDMPQHHINCFVNRQLFEWVIENLCKNAADAMDGQGTIKIEHGKSDNKIWVEVSDTGKGISKSNFKRIFTPGYTTKKRGWGLGLSLSRRIICQYHKGKIFVKSSELNKGTTFRIEIRIPKIV